jgi:hypothetical protein
MSASSADAASSEAALHSTSRPPLQQEPLSASAAGRQSDAAQPECRPPHAPEKFHAVRETCADLRTHTRLRSRPVQHAWELRCGGVRAQDVALWARASRIVFCRKSARSCSGVQPHRSRLLSMAVATCWRALACAASWKWLPFVRTQDRRNCQCCQGQSGGAPCQARSLHEVHGEIARLECSTEVPCPRVADRICHSQEVFSLLRWGWTRTVRSGTRVQAKCNGQPTLLADSHDRSTRHRGRSWESRVLHRTST